MDFNVLLAKLLPPLFLLDHANIEYVVDGVDDLPDLGRVFVLFVDLILKLLLEQRVSGGEHLQLALDGLHLPLLLVEAGLEVVEPPPLRGPRFIRFSVDFFFPSSQVLVLPFEAREPILEVLEARKSLVVARLVDDHCLEEIREDFVSLEVLFFARKGSLPLCELVLESLDFLLFAKDSQFLLGELLFLILALHRVLLEDRSFCSDIEDHLLLLLLILLPLAVKLSGTSDDILFLRPEVLLGLSLLPLFLEKANRL